MTPKNKPQTHTPGPWRVAPGTGLIHRDGDFSLRGVIAKVQGKDLSGRDWKERQDANARLIAAAPDLLEQLKAWQNWAETLPGGVEQFEKFARKQDNWADAPILAHTRAAILKATQGGI